MLVESLKRPNRITARETDLLARKKRFKRRFMAGFAIFATSFVADLGVENRHVIQEITASLQDEQPDINAYRLPYCDVDEEHIEEQRQDSDVSQKIDALDESNRQHETSVKELDLGVFSNTSDTLRAFQNVEYLQTYRSGISGATIKLFAYGEDNGDTLFYDVDMIDAALHAYVSEDATPLKVETATQLGCLRDFVASGGVREAELTIMLPRSALCFNNGIQTDVTACSSVGFTSPKTDIRMLGQSTGIANRQVILLGPGNESEAMKLRVLGHEGGHWLVQQYMLANDKQYFDIRLEEKWVQSVDSQVDMSAVVDDVPYGLNRNE